MPGKFNKNKKETDLLRVTLLLVASSLVQATAVRADVVEDLAAEFSELEKGADASAQNWFDLATKAREAGKQDLAARALERAAASGFSPIRVGIEKARQLIDAGDPEAAVKTLNELLEQGFTSVALLTSDPVIGTLAGRPDYDALVAEMTRQAFPCEDLVRFHEFDFWVGDWDVHLPNGTPAGTNSITREQHGCVLVEHWESATGGTGMSINYLDQATDEWVQIWNDAGGGQINIRGGLTGEGMALTGTIHYVGNGTYSPFRGLWTLLPDGRVRQFFEQSNDGGETWTPWFEGFYTRKAD